MDRTLMGLISGGKDSLYSLFIALHNSFDVRYTGSIQPPEDDMIFHIPNVEFTSIQAEAMGFKHKTVYGSIESLGKLLEGVKWMSVGALASDFQRFRFVWEAAKYGVKVFSPLWHVPPERYMREMVRDGFSFMVVEVGVYGLEHWLGKIISEDSIELFLNDLKRLNAHPGGEGGEYETFVVDSPLHKVRLKPRGIRKGRTFIIREVEMIDKN